MKSSWTAIWLVFLVALGGISTGCRAERSWDVRGRVVGFSDDGRRIFVSHENIPGLMPAMTMPFDVARSEPTSGLQIGDDIKFRLHANRDSSWIASIRLLAPNSSPLVLEEARPPAGLERDERLQPGEPIPLVQLVDHEGVAFTPARYRSRWLLLTFIYTRCPLPDFCPLMTARFKQIQAAILERDIPDVSLLSVSVDPEYDQPEVLRAYATTNLDTLAFWDFATGARDDIGRLAGSLGLSFSSGGGEIVHSLATALVDTAGRLSALWPGNQWEPEDVLARLDFVRGPTSGAEPR